MSELVNGVEPRRLFVTSARRGLPEDGFDGESSLEAAIAALPQWCCENLIDEPADVFIQECVEQSWNFSLFGDRLIDEIVEASEVNEFHDRPNETEFEEHMEVAARKFFRAHSLRTNTFNEVGEPLRFRWTVAEGVVAVPLAQPRPAQVEAQP